MSDRQYGLQPRCEVCGKPATRFFGTDHSAGCDDHPRGHQTKVAVGTGWSCNFCGDQATTHVMDSPNTARHACDACAKRQQLRPVPEPQLGECEYPNCGATATLRIGTDFTAVCEAHRTWRNHVTPITRDPNACRECGGVCTGICMGCGEWECSDCHDSPNCKGRPESPLQERTVPCDDCDPYVDALQAQNERLEKQLAITAENYERVVEQRDYCSRELESHGQQLKDARAENKRLQEIAEESDRFETEWHATLAENGRLRRALQEAIDTANGAYTAYANPNFKERAARWLTILG